jgi:hypothetical protein
METPLVMSLAPFLRLHAGTDIQEWYRQAYVRCCEIRAQQLGQLSMVVADIMSLFLDRLQCRSQFGNQHLSLCTVEAHRVRLRQAGMIFCSKQYTLPCRVLGCDKHYRLASKVLKDMVEN